NPNVQKVIFRAELSLSYASFDTSVPSSSFANDTKAFTFNQYNATITPQVVFNFYNKDKVKLYADAGVGINISMYTNEKYTENNMYGLQVQTPYPLNSVWLNFPVQAGAVLNKHIEVFVSYIPA